MATSAYTASIKAQRGNLDYSFGDSRRVLAPRNTKINTIAAQTAKNELAIMVDRYNDGLVGNDEMRNFLNQQMVNPGLDENDKADIQNYIRDFEVKIRKDALEAVFREAPEYSLEKVTAAQALQNFYSQRAATLSPGTPAQSQALENAARWGETVASEQNKVEKLQRKNFANATEAEIYSQTEPSSSARSYKLAEMYSNLAQSAQESGDEADYYNYMSLAQQQASQGDAYLANEDKREVAKQINDYKAEQELAISQLPNGSSKQIEAKAKYYYDLANMYASIGDQANSNIYLSKFNDSKQDYEKQALKEATGSFNAMDKEDYQYSVNIKDSFENYRKTGDAAQYQNEMKALIMDRAETIGNRINELEAIAEVNPNAKVTYNGQKTDVTNLLKTFYSQAEDLEPQFQAISNGTFALLALPPSQFSTTGTYKKSGSPVETYEIIDVNNIPEEYQGLIVPDENGVYHQGYRERTPVSMEEYNDAKMDYDNSYFFDQKTGQAYKLSDDLYVDLYRPGTSDKIAKVRVQAGQPVKTLDTLQKEAEDVWEQTAKFKQQYAKQQEEKKLAEMPVIDLDRRNILQKAEDKITRNIEEIKPKIQETVNKVQTFAEDKLPAMSTYAQDLIPKVYNTVSTTSPIQWASQKVADYTAPKVNLPTVQPSGTNSFSFSSQPNVTYTPDYSANALDLNKANQSGGLTYTQTPTAAKPVTPKAQEPSLGTKVLNVVKQSPFNFLKSLF